MVTGNTVIDVLHWAVRRARSLAPPIARARASHPAHLAPTREPGEAIRGACVAVRAIAGRGDAEIVFPYPQSRRPRCRASRARRGRGSARLRAARLPPTRQVLDTCDLVLTDSGGLQEEGPALGKPVLVLRDTTERPEAVEAGVARLVGTDPRAIVDAASELLDDPFAYEAMAHPRTRSATASTVSDRHRPRGLARASTGGVSRDTTAGERACEAVGRRSPIPLAVLAAIAAIVLLPVRQQLTPNGSPGLQPLSFEQLPPAPRIPAADTVPAEASPATRTLILYDVSGKWGWLGSLHATLTANLAGHFGRWTAKPAVAYDRGEVERTRR